MATLADQRSALDGPSSARWPGPARRPGLARLMTGSGDRMGSLLLILITTYLLSAFTEGGLVSAIQVVLFLVVLLLALRTGRLHRQPMRIAVIVLVAGTVGAGALQLIAHDKPAAGLADLWTALILLIASILIVGRVLARPQITVQSIYGAISAYLIIGLMFAALYSAMWHFGGGTFFAQTKAGDSKTFQYFSFTTLTTLGYGDYTAAGSGGQAVAMIEAIAGQIFLATLVARLVAGFRGSVRGNARRADRRPAGAKRASVRRASAPGMIRLRPPGSVRPRPPVPARPADPNGSGPDAPGGGTGPVPRRDPSPG
jgi:hypothetical protein